MARRLHVAARTCGQVGLGIALGAPLSTRDGVLLGLAVVAACWLVFVLTLAPPRGGTVQG